MARDRIGPWALSASLVLIAGACFALRGHDPRVPGETHLDADRRDGSAAEAAGLVAAREEAPKSRFPANWARTAPADERALEEPATLTVTVIDRERGTPAAGAPISTSIADCGWGRAADEHGVAILRVGPGRWRVSGDRWEEGVTVDLAAGEQRSIEVTWTIDSRPFRARIVDAATGAPVEGARLRWDGEPRALVSDASGAIVGRAPKRDAAVVVDHDAYARELVTDALGHETDETALVVALRRGGVVSGVVHAGGAYARASVRVWPARGADLLPFAAGAWEVSTDADGAFELAGLPTGESLDVEVWCAPRAQLHRVVLAEHEPLHLDVDLAARASLTGTLAWPDGLPIPGRALLLWGGGPDRADRGEPDARATTVANGAFRFDGVAPGTWTITLERRSDDDTEPSPLEPAVVQVVAPATRVELATFAPRFVSGRCEGPGGEPLAWVELGLVRNGELIASGFSDESGAFRLGPVRGGECGLTAITCPHRLRRPADVELAAGASGVALRFEPR